MRAASEWNSFANQMQQAINTFEIVEPPIKVEILSEPDELINYAGINKTIQTTARVGQNFFRQSVLSAYNYRCCITGLTIPKLLVASHIVPWRVDEKNRLNPRNGLCLSMLHDKAFDIGIITILEDMTVKVSKKCADNSDSFFNSALLAYDGKPISLSEKFRPHADFLAYHHEHIFER